MIIKVILLLMFSNPIYSQNSYFELNTIKRSEIILIEKKFKGTNSKESQNQIYFGEERNFSSLNYKREATDNFPATIVQYLYSPKDSFVKSITFDWILEIDEKFSQATKVEKYNVAFEDLVKSMSIVIGDPKPNQGQVIQIESPVQHDKTLHYKRMVVWKINSKTVTALIVWAENHGHQMITTIK